MALALSNRVLLRRSAAPFCSGLYGTVVWWMVPLDFRNSVSSELTYSVPLSVLMAFTRLPHWVCSSLMTSRTTVGVLALESMILTKDILEKSFMKVATYLFPPSEATGMGPHGCVGNRSKA